MTKPTTHTFCKDKKGRRCTVAIRQATSLYTKDTVFNVAVALTSKGDNFSRKIGKSIAYGRLDKADSVEYFVGGVEYCLDRQYVINFLTSEFDISENRAILMIDKDLLYLPPPGTAFSRALDREERKKSI